MPVRRINIEAINSDPSLLDISDEEIVLLYNEIKQAHEKYLAVYGIKFQEVKQFDKKQNKLPNSEIIKQMTARTLQLIFLYKYAECLVHREVISLFVRKHIPTAASDQQARHLGSQCGWNILNMDRHIPNTDEIVESGYHYLISIEQPSQALFAAELKRVGRVAAKNFEQLKISYNNRCATCGIEEGKSDPRLNGSAVSLQQGHMDPRKALDLSNTIPQCQYCNQTYKDYFRFNEHGRVIAVNNPEILLQSPRDIRDEMIAVLTRAKQAEENKTKNK